MKNKKRAKKRQENGWINTSSYRLSSIPSVEYISSTFSKNVSTKKKKSWGARTLIDNIWHTSFVIYIYQFWLVIYSILNINICMTKGYSRMMKVIDKYLYSKIWLHTITKIYILDNLENDLQYILLYLFFHT